MRQKKRTTNQKRFKCNQVKKLNRNSKYCIQNPRWKQALLCVVAGFVLYGLAEISDNAGSSVEKGQLFRNPCGKGDAVYEFYVDGLDGADETPVLLTVPEQKMTGEEFSARLPEIVSALCEEILGENPSLDEVRSDLKLVRELPEYGITVRWESEKPEVISDLGLVEAPVPESESGNAKETGPVVYLQAELLHGELREVVEIPVIVYPPVETMETRFLTMLEQLVVEESDRVDVILPQEFEGASLSYRTANQSGNLALVFLGLIAGGVLLMKEKSDLEAERKRREKSLMEDYPDLVSGFLILTGAGYPPMAAWKKLTMDRNHRKHVGYHPLYEEMQMAVNQMETGVAETRVYAEFGRRCQLRCYMKFASLLESSVHTGGRQLRTMLEQEVEEAFQQRTDLARRKGEELSTKLLLPMFGMLGVVLVMVIAPAFLGII